MIYESLISLRISMSPRFSNDAGRALRHSLVLSHESGMSIQSVFDFAYSGSSVKHLK